MTEGNNSMRKIDCYTHYAPPSLLKFLSEVSNSGEAPFQYLFDKIPSLTMTSNEDIESRLSFMDKHNIQCGILIPLPWLESVEEVYNDEEKSIKACMIANEEMAELVRRYPSRFLGVALVPTGVATSAIMKVYNHAIHKLRLCGSALFFGPDTKCPADAEKLDQLYRESHIHNTPIWIHPCRSQSYSDYDIYKEKGSMYAIWNSLGWVYDTSVAMVHIVMSGALRKYPNLKIVAHHGGGMIPFFYNRFLTQMANFDIKENYLDDLRKIYCDTAMFGYEPNNLMQCLEFFDKGRVMFGTDTPMDMSNPGFFVESSIKVVEHLKDVGRSDDVESVFIGNVLAMLGHHANSIRKAIGLEALPCPLELQSKL